MSSTVPYDTKTVLTRYARLQDLPDGEAAEPTCPLAAGAQQPISGSCDTAGCQSCCLGVAEMVRRIQAECSEDTQEANGSEPTDRT